MEILKVISIFMNILDYIPVVVNFNIIVRKLSSSLKAVFT